MTTRRETMLVLAAALLSPAARSQSGGAVSRIGYFGNGQAPANGLAPAVLRDALRDFGYVEGKNVEYVARWAELRPERLPAIAREMVDARLDVVVCIGYPTAQAMKAATSTIPIVFLSVGDPVASGLVASLARPGANLTGLSDQSDELSAKRMEILKELRPNAARIAVMWNASNEAMTLRYREIERAATALHIDVQPLGVREPGEFDGAFAAMSRARPDALLVITDALTNANQGRVVDFASKNDVPAMYEFGPIVRSGGLISYGPNPDDAFRRVAGYVNRILKGAKPAQLPVEQPTHFELLLNMRTAKSLGVTIPNSVFVRADEVIQ